MARKQSQTRFPQPCPSATPQKTVYQVLLPHPSCLKMYGAATLIKQYSRWVFPCNSAWEAGVDENNAKAKQHRQQTLQQGPPRSPTKQWPCLSLQADHYSQTAEAKKKNHTFWQNLLGIWGIMLLTVTLQFPVQGYPCLSRKSCNRWHFTLHSTQPAPKPLCISSVSLHLSELSTTSMS